MRLNRLCIIAFLSIAPSICFGQASPDVLKQIDKEVIKINNEKDHKLKSLLDIEVNPEAAHGRATLIAYYKDTVISKMQLWVGLSRVVWDGEYYFKDGALIYGIEKQKGYIWDSAHNGYDYNHTYIINETIYYFDKDKIIAQADNGKVLEPIAFNTEQANKTIQNCKEFLEKLSKKKPLN